MSVGAAMDWSRHSFTIEALKLADGIAASNALYHPCIIGPTTQYINK
jgi:hypothetical protein